MSTNAATNRLFFKTVSSLNGFAGADETSALLDVHPRFVLTLILSAFSSEQELRRIGLQLTRLASSARSAGRMDVVRGVSEAITILPLPDEIKTAGLYYQAVVENHSGNVEQARLALAQIASGPQNSFRCHAILGLGKTFFDAGDHLTATTLYVEAAKASKGIDLLANTLALIMIAVVRSMDGDHRNALHDLDRLWPMVRLASQDHPALRYDYLNSRAVELAETGRIQEAKHAIEIALRSPFSDRYPNWRATRDEIADKEREISYRPRLLSLAGESLPAAPTVPERAISDPSQLNTSEVRRHDLCFEIQELSPNAAAGPLILVPSFIRLGIKPSKTEAEAAIPSLITIVQTGLAPNSRKSLERMAVASTSLPEASAHSRMSESSAWCCHAIGDPPDDIWAAEGYPKSPLARGPPPTSIRQLPTTT